MGAAESVGVSRRVLQGPAARGEWSWSRERRLGAALKAARMYKFTSLKLDSGSSKKRRKLNQPSGSFSSAPEHRNSGAVAERGERDLLSCLSVSQSPAISVGGVVSEVEWE